MYAAYYLLWAANIYLCWKLLALYLNARSPFIFFWIIVLAIFLVPAATDPFVESFQGHVFSVEFRNSIANLVEVQVITLLILLCFLLLYKALPFSTFPSVIIGKTRTIEISWALILLVGTLVPLLEIIGSFGPLFFLNFGFSDRRDSVSYLGQFLLSYNVLCGAGIAYWAFNSGHRTLALVFSLYYLGLFSFLGGSRQPIIALLLPFLGFYLFSTTFRKSKIALLLLGSQVFLIILSSLLIIRYQTSIEDKWSLLLSPSVLFSAALDRSDETSVRYAFYYFVQEIDTFSHFGQFEYLRRALLFWLPSPIDVLKIKPDDFEFRMFSSYMPGFEGTMHPTFFGSIFADSKFFFPVWVVVVHTYFFICSRILARQRSQLFALLIWSVLASGAVMMGRGSLYAPIVVSAFAFFYFFIGSFFIRIRFAGAKG